MIEDILKELADIVLNQTYERGKLYLRLKQFLSTKLKQAREEHNKSLEKFRVDIEKEDYITNDADWSWQEEMDSIIEQERW